MPLQQKEYLKQALRLGKTKEVTQRKGCIPLSLKGKAKHSSFCNIHLLNMKTTFLLLSLFAAWFIFCGVLCEPLGGPEPEYDFLVDIRIFPEKAEYKVGDTIWLEIKIPNNKLLDTWSEDSILLENAFLPLNLEISEHLKKEPFDSTFVSFFVQDSSGVLFTESNFENFRSIQLGYGCNQDTLGFQLGICLKKPGIYNLAPEYYQSAQFTFGSGIDCQTGAGTGQTALISYIYAVNDVHEHIYEKVKTPSNPHTFIRGGISMEAFIFSKRVYWFEVVQ